MIESASSAPIAPAWIRFRATRVDSFDSPAAVIASRHAAAPVAVAVETKIGPRNRRERDHTGTAVDASRTPV